ncbi:hypothetical protein FJY63_11125, partial [Candidatus Sumerlaeota bacterium]|nr:hypothetical protein [Candidatus Sumerlaeota bacterium]
MNYRERCFSSYEVTWDVYHGGSEREYELYARQWARVFLRFLPRDRSAAILDVGCGAGHCLY